MEKGPNLKTAVHPAWEKRAIILSAFGLVGFGALVGAISVYVLFIKYRIEQHFRIQAAITSKVHEFNKSSKKDLRRKSSLHNDVLRRYSSFAEIDKSTIIASMKSATVGASKKSSKILKLFQIRTSEEPHSSHSLLHPVLKKTDGTKTDGERPKVQIASSKTNETQVTIVGTESGDQCAADDEESQVESFFFKIDIFLDGPPRDQKEALEKLDVNKEKLKHTAEFWWRFSKASHLAAEAAEKQQDKDLQKTLLQKAVSYAEKALKLNEKSADAHKWYAVSLGSLGEFLGVSHKIQNGFIFKSHIDRAVALNPSDSSLHHLLGRFCFEVAKLSWIERRMASALFSAPPTATIKEALEHFRNAEKLGNPFIENRYYISKCYIEMNDSKKAAQWLLSASQLPAISANDKSVQKSVNDLLVKYQKHLPS